MHIIIIKVILLVITAFFAAGLLALLKIGASEITRYVEKRWELRGVISIILCWVVLFPIMTAISLLTGLYIFLTVEQDYALRH